MRKCSVPGCERTYSKKGYCGKHYYHMYRYGEIRNRTMKDKNEFVIEGVTTRLFLYNIQQEKVAETIIDTNDLERCRKIKWGQGNKGYVIGTPPGRLRYTYLAWFLMGKINHTDLIVDHKDGNPLNNRKDNLQFITQPQNMIKKGRMSNNSTGYRGVSRPKNRNRYVAHITKDKKCLYIGCFADKHKAALAYNKKAKELHGEFAVLNRIPIIKHLNTEVVL